MRDGNVTHKLVRTVFGVVLCSASFLSQAQALNPATQQQILPPLTLAQAETIAIANQPRMLAAQLRARASVQRIREARSNLYPTIAFNATGVGVADTGTATAAGALTTSSISDRFAYGGNLVQLVTDFGRTSALIASSRSNAEAQADLATLTMAQLKLNVRKAYYEVLGSEAVLHAADDALNNRKLISRQIGALAQSQLRSTLDVNFAGVLESEAELAVVRAQSTVQQMRVHLASTMGLQQPIVALVADVALPAPLDADPTSLLPQADTQRADLGAAQAEQKAAAQFALSEKRLSYPTLSAAGVAGEIPFHDHTLHNNYAAAGFNLNIPVFNGGLFAARRSEAELEANARTRDAEELKLEVNEQVRDGWYRADEAFRSLDVSARLVAQSKEALRLAKARYDAGLGSIVELNEAQLNETSAEIGAADATYSYLMSRADLDYAAGLLN